MTALVMQSRIEADFELAYPPHRIWHFRLSDGQRMLSSMKAVIATLGIILLPVTASAGVPHTVFELRQYTLHPDQRDVLVNVFDDHFIEGQEAQGIRAVGQYRDLDNPDRFVWLRSLSDMRSREAALKSFYSSPLWKAHGRIAGATMVDWGNVLLLRPLRPKTTFPTATIALPPPGARGPGKGLLLASIVYIEQGTPTEFGAFFERQLKPHRERAGAAVLAQMVSEHSPNTCPSLPVRGRESVFVWFSLFPDQASRDKQQRTPAQSTE